jgi:hypothetical protein
MQILPPPSKRKSRRHLRIATRDGEPVPRPFAAYSIEKAKEALRAEIKRIAQQERSEAEQAFTAFHAAMRSALGDDDPPAVA